MLACSMTCRAPRHREHCDGFHCRCQHSFSRRPCRFLALVQIAVTCYRPHASRGPEPWRLPAVLPVGLKFSLATQHPTLGTQWRHRHPRGIISPAPLSPNVAALPSRACSSFSSAVAERKSRHNCTRTHAAAFAHSISGSPFPSLATLAPRRAAPPLPGFPSPHLILHLLSLLSAPAIPPPRSCDSPVPCSIRIHLPHHWSARRSRPSLDPLIPRTMFLQSPFLRPFSRHSSPSPSSSSAPIPVLAANLAASPGPGRLLPERNRERYPWLIPTSFASSVSFNPACPAIQQSNAVRLAAMFLLYASYA